MLITRPFSSLNFWVKYNSLLFETWKQIESPVSVEILKSFLNLVKYQLSFNEQR